MSRTLVDASEVTILCLPDSPDVVAVLDVALPSLGCGEDRRRHVDHLARRRTGTARSASRATGARYLEAPLSGGTVGAEKGAAHPDGGW